jgi:hypothetical protein
VLSRGWGASGRTEAALQVVQQREQADALEGAVAAPDAGLSKNASLLQSLALLNGKTKKGRGVSPLPFIQPF